MNFILFLLISISWGSLSSFDLQTFIQEDFEGGENILVCSFVLLGGLLSCNLGICISLVSSKSGMVREGWNKEEGKMCWA